MVRGNQTRLGHSSLQSTADIQGEEHEPIHAERPESRKTIKNLWSPVREYLNFDPTRVESDDLKQIISGLVTTVDGIGSLRTHAGRAHGRGRVWYRIDPRHGLLAVNAASTVASFVLESWNLKKQAW